MSSAGGDIDQRYGLDGDFTPGQRRRNLVLGLLLGAFVVGSMVLFITVFSRHGLPKSPSELKRQEARAQAEAEAAAPAAPAAPAATPAAPTVTDPSAEPQPR